MKENFPILNLPPAKLKLTEKEGKKYVWDAWRKKELVLTPEEWVRQHLLHYLVYELDFPKSLLAVEFAIEVNKLKRRCDIVAFDKTGSPKLIIECKAPHIQLTETTFSQIAQYNFNLQVDFLIMTNGLQHIIAYVDRNAKSIQYLEKFPLYDEITKPN